MCSLLYTKRIFNNYALALKKSFFGLTAFISLHSLISLKKCLNKDGILIISGILDKHINRVLSKFSDLEQVNLIHKNEWVSVIFKNNKEL